MSIYIVMSVVTLFLGYFLKVQSSKKRRAFYIAIIGIMLIIVSGFRDYSVGSDTISYTRAYDIISYSDAVHYEWGFIEYMRLLHRLSSNPGFFLLINSVICIASVCRFTYKHSKNAVLSLVLYITVGGYSLQMTGLRQALSIAVLLSAFSCMIENKKIRSLVLILFSGVFHNSAFVGLLPYMIWVLGGNTLMKYLNSKNVTCWAMGIAIALFAMYGVVMRAISIVLPKYTFYFTGTWSDSNYSASLINTLIQVVFLLVGSFYYYGREFDEVDVFSALMMVFSVSCTTLSMRMEIWSRLASTFSIFTALIWVPGFSTRITRKYERAAVEYWISVLCILYMIIILTFRPEWSSIVPYKNRLFM